jgi:predicted nucleic acid-binding protein
MSRYYDTGILLKLYTPEAGSDAVRKFVIRHKQALLFSSLHLSECVSALQLKCFRKECGESEAAAAILDLEADQAAGVLRKPFIEWEEAWTECRNLSTAHAATTGCRTLDALHVACAKQLGVREFVTSDARQMKLAGKAGLRVLKVS